jgi:hypothetical protein
VVILARGLVKPLWARVYFADTGDPLLAALAPGAARHVARACRAGRLATPPSLTLNFFSESPVCRRNTVVEIIEHGISR